MLSIGKHIRQLRLQRGYSPGSTAAFLDIDETLLLKIETGRRSATKDQIIKLASFLGANEKNMLTAYLSERTAQRIKGRGSSKRYENLSSELNHLYSGKIITKVHKPAPPLNEYIETIVYYSGDNKHYSYERVLPDGVVQLVIALDENERIVMPDNMSGHSISLKNYWIAGIQKKYRTYRLHPHETTLSIRFTPDGFYALMNVPVTEIENQIIDADQILGRSIESLRERIASCENISTVIHTAEQYFLNRIIGQENEHLIVRYLLHNINVPLHLLAKKTGYSQKHLIHLFKKYVGITPKYFQRICRFNRSLTDILTMNGEMDFYDIVFDHGYYDQPHFIKEFKHFTGLSPRSYLESGSTCSKLLHLHDCG